MNVTQKYELIRPILKGEKTPLSSRQIAEALAGEENLKIHYRTVVNMLKEHGLTAPFFSTNYTN